MALPFAPSLPSRRDCAAREAVRPRSGWRVRRRGARRPPLGLGALAWVGLSALTGAILASSPTAAAPTPDLRPYPPAAPGERRWFIPVEDAAAVAAPGATADLRVELILGRSLLVDCNRHLLQGALVEESVPGWGYPMFRVKGGSQLVSTRMACPGQAPRRTFVRLGGPPTLVPVNPRLPIVVVAPKELEVRWRLWRPDPSPQAAKPF